MNNQGQYINTNNRVVTEKQRVETDSYREYIKIWGVPNEKNLSAPVLTKPTDANKEFKYNEKPY
jgi:hypothetical protein